MQLSDIDCGEAAVTSDLRWTARTAKVEHCVTSGSYHVNVCRCVVVRKNDNSQSLDSCNCRHQLTPE